MKKVLAFESPDHPVVQLQADGDIVADTRYGRVNAERLDVCGLSRHAAYILASETVAGERLLASLFPENEEGLHHQEERDTDTYVIAVFTDPGNERTQVHTRIKGFRISSLVEPASDRPK